ELNMVLPISVNITVQQEQREQMAVMGVLATLPATYNSARAYILASLTITSLEDAYSRVARFGVPNPASALGQSSAQPSTALVGRGGPDPKQHYAPPSSESRGSSSKIICHYCKKSGHVIQDCRKLKNKNQRGTITTIASTTDTSTPTIPVSHISAEEFARFQQYQASLQSSSVA
ncbi:zinc finger CCHC domain-containing protein, partial [Heyndrickxia coagulans]|uniref:zinc finger CCHC domain-containing protein n=1 Tax=Heyndrickxia coagulans TaxID=1398 RepID=UPI00214D3500